MFFGIHINHVSLAKRSLVNAANYRVANVSGNISKFPPFCSCIAVETIFKNHCFTPNGSGRVERCIVVKSRQLTGMFPGPKVSELPVFLYVSMTRWRQPVSLEAGG